MGDIIWRSSKALLQTHPIHHSGSYGIRLRTCNSASQIDTQLRAIREHKDWHWLTVHRVGIVGGQHVKLLDISITILLFTYG